MSDISKLCTGPYTLFDFLAFVVKIKKVSSYIARYPVFGTAQSALHFTPGRPVHSKAISTSRGIIQPRCNNSSFTYPPLSIVPGTHLNS